MDSKFFVSYDENPSWVSKKPFISNEPISKIKNTDCNFHEYNIIRYFKNINQKKIKIVSKIFIFYLTKKRANNYLSSLEC